MKKVNLVFVTLLFFAAFSPALTNDSERPLFSLPTKAEVFEGARVASPYVGGAAALGGLGGFAWVRYQLAKDKAELIYVRNKIEILSRSIHSVDGQSELSLYRNRYSRLKQRIKTLTYLQWILLTVGAGGAIGGAGMYYYNNYMYQPPVVPDNPEPQPEPEPAPQPQPEPKDEAPKDPDEDVLEPGQKKYGVSLDHQGRKMLHEIVADEAGAVSRKYLGVIDRTNNTSRGSEIEKHLGVLLMRDHPLVGQEVPEDRVIRSHEDAAKDRFKAKVRKAGEHEVRYQLDYDRDDVGIEASSKDVYRVERDENNNWVRTHKRVPGRHGVTDEELKNIHDGYGKLGDGVYSFERVEPGQAAQGFVRSVKDWKTLMLNPGSLSDQNSEYSGSEGSGSESEHEESIPGVLKKEQIKDYKKFVIDLVLKDPNDLKSGDVFVEISDDGNTLWRVVRFSDGRLRRTHVCNNYGSLKEKPERAGYLWYGTYVEKYYGFKADHFTPLLISSVFGSDYEEPDDVVPLSLFYRHVNGVRSGTNDPADGAQGQLYVEYVASFGPDSQDKKDERVFVEVSDDESTLWRVVEFPDGKQRRTHKCDNYGDLKDNPERVALYYDSPVVKDYGFAASNLKPLSKEEVFGEDGQVGEHALKPVTSFAQEVSQRRASSIRESFDSDSD